MCIEVYRLKGASKKSPMNPKIHLIPAQMRQPNQPPSDDAVAPKASAWSCSSMTQPPSVSPTANQRLPSTCTNTSDAKTTWPCAAGCRLKLVKNQKKISEN